MHNVDISIENTPRKHTLKSLNIKDPNSLFGLYTGIPLSKRGHFYSFVCPDKIILYKKNIERISNNIEELKKNIFETLIHEIAHYFGMDEFEVRNLGY